MRGKWAEAKEYIQDFDVITITETKLDSKATLSSVSMENYTTNRLDRNHNGGGVITYINNRWKPVPLDDIQTEFNFAHLEVTVTEITLKNLSKVIIIGAYRPPNSASSWFDSFNQLILAVTVRGPLIVMGDLNCNVMKTEIQPAKALTSSLALASVIIHHNYITHKNRPQ